ncbi:histidine phosphatase family protein [Thermophagus sp. OGC60D27]|uniref:histidine phosphatase family protein n=1 Tax=Thermophagus sp. OGC60D27 TaxID=3458415 RepID=UPI004037EBF7
MPKRIYFMRHPKTEVPQGICYGISDVKPSEEGLAMAVEKVGLKLKGVRPEICFSSPLIRCTTLAEAFLTPEKIVRSRHLREIDFGRWELKPWVDISQEEQKAWGEDFINCKVHGGENFFDVQKRVLTFLEEVVQTSYNNILVVTHAGLLRALLAHLLEASPRKIFALHIDYGDVFCLEWHNNEYYKVKYL